MNFNALLKTAINASIEGGHAIMKVYASEFSVEHKEDKSPLTLADNKSEFITSNITEHLRTNLEINKLFTSCKYNIQEENSLVTLYPNNQS